jgi:hypothetical protein
MQIEPLTLASLAPMQSPRWTAEVNGHTLGKGGPGVSYLTILHPKEQVLHTYLFQPKSIKTLAMQWTCQTTSSALENIKTNQSQSALNLVDVTV